MADPVGFAREIALRQLTVRARTAAELRQAMARRKVPAEAADEVIARFTEVGLIDDAAFARDWVAAGSRRHRSRRALTQELRGKGVDPEFIQEAMNSTDPDQELEVARALAERKVATMRGLERPTAYRRLVGALSRRGFPAAVVSQVVAESLGEWAGDQTGQH